MVTPAAERKAVAHLVQHHAMSERRACKAIGCCRMTVRYQSARPDDRALRERMIAIARERRRFGYRRLHVLLKREGHLVNHKRLFRLYREEKLAVRRRGGRKRAIGTRAPMLVPLGPNERWSLDFVSDQFTDGRRFRILAIVDDCTRENLALVADTSLSGLRVARELDRVIAERGRPKMDGSKNLAFLSVSCFLEASAVLGLSMSRMPGFFDVDERLKRLSELGDQLEAYARAVDFETFRPGLEKALAYSTGAQGGRPPYDPVLMLKILVIQAANGLSDERAEFLISDRLSFMRFLGLGLSDRVPDARTIWLFRERLTKAGVKRPPNSPDRSHP